MALPGAVDNMSIMGQPLQTGVNQSDPQPDFINIFWLLQDCCNASFSTDRIRTIELHLGYNVNIDRALELLRDFNCNMKISQPSTKNQNIVYYYLYASSVPEICHNYFLLDFLRLFSKRSFPLGSLMILTIL
jgi:hypothetical protein